MKEKLDSFIAKILPLAAYFIVGVLATLVEWIFFYLFNSICSFHYQLATILAIVISTFSNWMFGRIIVFQKAEKKNLFVEIAKIYLASIVGLLLNMLIMWFLVEKNNIAELIAKIIATCIVFAYNYLIRKLVIYKK